MALILTPWASGAAVAGPRQQVTWYLSAWGAPRAVTNAMEVLAETVERETGGGFTIDIQYGEALSPQRENLDSISVGIIEAAHVCPNNHPGKTPLMLAPELPFLPIDGLEAAQRFARVYYRHPEVVRELDRYDAVALMQTTSPRYEFMGKGPPPLNIADWTGKRVRAPGNVGEAVRALGGQPTSVPTPEIYNALDRGMFDAATLPFPYAFGAYRIHEVAEWYTINMTAAMPNCFMAVSRGALEALPEVYRDALFAAAPAAAAAQIDLLNAEEAAWLAAFDSAGLARIEYASEQIEALKARSARRIWDAWVADADRRGLPGRALFDFIYAEAEKASAAVTP